MDEIEAGKVPHNRVKSLAREAEKLLKKTVSLRGTIQEDSTKGHDDMLIDEPNTCANHPGSVHKKETDSELEVW